MNKYKQQSIGREAAIKLYGSKWWEGKDMRDVVKFQLFTQELSMPFDIFYEMLEKTLHRPIFTHELACNFDGIVMEFLGEKDAPTLDEIIDVIPDGKRIVIIHSAQKQS